jgi:hypothetical protein
MGRDKKGKLQKKPPLNSILTGKEAVRKISAIGKIYKQEENKSSPPPPNSPSWMVSVGYCSLD